MSADEPRPPNAPGKMRTWWHPLLVGLLDWELGDAYEVRGEVNVGTAPLRADIVLIRRESGELPESARRDLRILVERLNRWTLIEFKGPTDALDRFDLDRLLGVAYLFCSQQPKPIRSSDLSLIVLAPRLNRPFRENLRVRGFSAHEEEPGVHRLEGLSFSAWIIETDRITGPQEPILTLVSRTLLRDPRRIIEQIGARGHASLLQYVLQQVRQFDQLEEGFAMRRSD
ncbi:MAG: hypothetical protein ACREJB_17280, partial [Planctomycetaceae bacterium]